MSDSRRAGPALAGVAALVLAVAWLPGQTSTGAARAWLCAGALPCLILWRGHLRGGLWWVLLAGTALLGWSGAGVALAAWQLGWWAALVLGRHAAAQHQWIAVAGLLAAIPGLIGPTGLFGNPDYLAAFVALCVPSMVAHARADRRWLLGLLIVGGALLRASSLGAWAALAITGVVMLQIRHRAWAFACLLVLLITGVFGRDVIERHIEGRMHLFATSARLVKDHPLTGTGAGAFHSAFLQRQVGTVERVEQWTNAHHAHHDGLQIAAEQGVPAALLFAIPLLLAGWRRPWTTWHATALTGVLLGSVNPLLHMPGACFLFAHAVGAALGPPRSTAASSAWTGRVLGIALLGLATHQLIADRLLARADANQNAQLAATAAGWSLEPARALRVAAAHRAPDAQALAWAEAAETHDLSVEGVMLRGRILHGLGRYEEAIAAFEEAVRLNRWLFAGWFNLARAHEDRGDRAAARTAAQRARRLRPSDARLRHLPE